MPVARELLRLTELRGHLGRRRTLSFAKVIVVGALLGGLPGSNVIAQPTPQQGAEPDPGICRQLVAFLEQHPNLPQDSTPVTLAEATRFAREDNRYACRSGIYGLHKDGIALPQRLLDAIGLKAN